jgi:UDPglucose 6-dehydrogenase
MKKKISLIGIGKLGICFGLNLSKAGYEVIGIDLREDYVSSLNKGEFISDEPYVNEYLEKHPFQYTSDIKKALDSDIIFILVATPSTEDNKYDHYQIERVIGELTKENITNRKDLIINCTTFPGYCEDLQNRLKDTNWKISYNPEFIAQGTIIRDQQYCDMVLIGEYDNYIGNIIESIYKDFVLSNPVYKRMSVSEAELTKLSLNCFLTTKISFANMIGDIAKKINCNPNIVLDAIGSDTRVGKKYLNYGFGFGGPCFPRDNRSLAKCAEEVGIDAIISKATDEMNKKHLDYQIEDFIKNNDKSKEVDMDFVTYKKDSTLLEESQQLKFALKLKDLGYNIRLLDERVEVLKKLKNIL